MVNVFVTLPSGDEEIITSYKMKFKERKISKNQDASVLKMGDGSQHKGPVDLDDVLLKDDHEGGETDATSQVALEFNLATLVSFIKRQGFPVESSYISYYSADFQA